MRDMPATTLIVSMTTGSARVTAMTTRTTGAVEVKVELPLRRLWEILRRSMKVEEVEPPAAKGAPAKAPPTGKDE